MLSDLSRCCGIPLRCIIIVSALLVEPIIVVYSTELISGST